MDPVKKKKWTVVASQSVATSHFWRPNRDCPTGTGVNALAELRKRVDDGEFVMAQRRVEKFRYELVIMKASK